MIKNLPAMQRPGFEPWVEKIPWRRAWQLTPVFLPREFPWTEVQSMGSQRVHTRLNNLADRIDKREKCQYCSE